MHFLGGSKQFENYRSIEEELENGCRWLFFNWDCEKGAPCSTSWEQERGVMKICVFSLVFDRAVRRWRCFGGDFTPLPGGWLVSSKMLLPTPFVRLIEMNFRGMGKRAIAMMNNIVDQRLHLYGNGSTPSPS